MKKCTNVFLDALIDGTQMIRHAEIGERVVLERLVFTQTQTPILNFLPPAAVDVIQFAASIRERNLKP